MFKFASCYFRDKNLNINSTNIYTCFLTIKKTSKSNRFNLLFFVNNLANLTFEIRQDFWTFVNENQLFSFVLKVVEYVGYQYYLS